MTTAKKRGGRKRGSKSEPGLPSREQILKFVSETPGKVGKREIGRAFQITGAQRIGLKRLLREMADEGLLNKEPRRALRAAGELPPVGVIDIVRRDIDGELIARPVNWRDDEGPAPDIVLVPDAANKRRAGPAAGIGDRVLARLSKTGAAGPDTYGYEARIIRRVSRAADTVLGIFRAAKDGGGRLVPVDKRNRNELTIDKNDAGKASDGDLVVGETLPGPRYGLKRARIRETHGRGDDQQSISLIAIHAHGIPVEFPEAVLRQTDKAKPQPLGTRTDLRDLPLITIDPEDARDHDDAVWAAPDDDPANKGGWVVVVAIADVAAYVTSGSALDREAHKRGNSTYFPDHVVPMLPERISNDLCSLKEKVDRPCLAVRMVFDRNGVKKSHQFMRAMMRSAARLSYAQAQSAFDGKPDAATEPLMSAVVEPLWRAYQALAAARDKRAPLDLDLPEYKIALDDKGRVTGIAQSERFESMRLIEECMIQANVAAAETLNRKRSPLLYRVHDTPSKEKLVALGEFLASLGMKIAKGQHLKPEHFNRILEQARQSEHAQMVSDVVLRSQAQAVYAPDNLGHFGLNLRRYAHFTSPIRRYADLIVHRALIAAEGFGKDGLTGADIEALGETAEHISQTERRSMLAERESTDRYVAGYLSGNIGATFQGRISGVTRFGLFVRLDDTGADGLIPISSLDDDFYAHDETLHALIGRRGGRTFRLGDRVEVRLDEAVPVTGGLRFSLISGGAKAAKTRRPPKSRPARGRRKRG